MRDSHTIESRHFRLGLKSLPARGRRRTVKACQAQRPIPTDTRRLFRGCLMVRCRGIWSIALVLIAPAMGLAQYGARPVQDNSPSVGSARTYPVQSLPADDPSVAASPPAPAVPSAAAGEADKLTKIGQALE